VSCFVDVFTRRIVKPLLHWRAQRANGAGRQWNMGAWRAQRATRSRICGGSRSAGPAGFPYIRCGRSPLTHLSMKQCVGAFCAHPVLSPMFQLNSGGDEPKSVSPRVSVGGAFCLGMHAQERKPLAEQGLHRVRWRTWCATRSRIRGGPRSAGPAGYPYSLWISVGYVCGR